MSKKLGFHPASDIFPLARQGLAALVTSIRQKGLRDPIAMLDGKILDGRRRWLACQLAKVKPRFYDVAPVDPIAYVLSQDAHQQRHLFINAAAMSGGRAWVLHQRYAAAEGPAKSHKKGATQKGIDMLQIASLLRVSETSIRVAIQVLRNGSPELVSAVEACKLSLTSAAIISKEPLNLQQRQLAKALKGERPRLRKVSPPPPPQPRKEQPKEDDVPPGTPRGVGIHRGNEAINALSRIPRNDRLRERGFQIVEDWIRHNRRMS